MFKVIMPRVSKKEVNTQVQSKLSSWGKCIRSLRISQNITEKGLCARIGVSLPTLKRLQNGAPEVAAGTYLEALLALGAMGQAAPELSNELVEPRMRDSKEKIRARPVKRMIDDDF